MNALARLRDAKRQELAGGGGGGGAESDVRTLVREYERALREDLELRFVGPGVRLWGVGEDDDPTMGDDVAAARQFLGLDLRMDGSLEPR